MPIGSGNLRLTLEVDATAIALWIEPSYRAGSHNARIVQVRRFRRHGLPVYLPSDHSSCLVADQQVAWLTRLRSRELASLANGKVVIGQWRRIDNDMLTHSWLRTPLPASPCF